MYVNLIAECSRPQAIRMEDIIEETSKDKDLQKLREWIVLKNQSSIPKEILHYKKIANEICQTRNGILLRGQRILMPKSLQKRTIDLAHQGHQGIVKTKALIRSKVWFSGIDDMVEERIRFCKVCQASSAKTEYAPLIPSEMPKGPWQKVDGDFFGPMPDGTFYFVNYDKYSRWAAVDNIRNPTFELTKSVLDKLFAILGIPQEYKRDNGSPFQSYQFADYAKLMGFKHHRIILDGRGRTVKWNDL